MNIYDYIRLVPDFPDPGILFRDITPLLATPEAFDSVMEHFIDRYQKMDIDAIAAIDSRGFIFGAVLAHALKLPLILIRKKGKLPAEAYQESYHLEYGTNTLEMHKDALPEKAKVVIFDDLLATGGTALAATRLIQKSKGIVVELAFLIHLKSLMGEKTLEGFSYFAIISDER